MNSFEQHMSMLSPEPIKLRQTELIPDISNLRLIRFFRHLNPSEIKRNPRTLKQIERKFVAKFFTGNDVNVFALSREWVHVELDLAPKNNKLNTLLGSLRQQTLLRRLSFKQYKDEPKILVQYKVTSKVFSCLLPCARMQLDKFEVSRVHFTAASFSVLCRVVNMMPVLSTLSILCYLEESSQFLHVPQGAFAILAENLERKGEHKIDGILLELKRKLSIRDIYCILSICDSVVEDTINLSHSDFPSNNLKKLVRTHMERNRQYCVLCSNLMPVISQNPLFDKI